MEVLVMPNGQTEIISDERDLIEFIGRVMGYEVKIMVEEISKRADKAAILADSDFKSYEMQVEENHDAFQELAGLVNRVYEELDKERMNKKKITSIIDRMDHVVSNQI
jgi:hypothetical protein